MEIEAKVKVDSHEPVIEKLGQCGAALLAKVTQHDSYFDSADESLSAGDKGLRIRWQVSAGVERVVLTFKGKCVEGKYKSRSEHEVEVGDHNKIVKILTGLGYVKKLAVEKSRQIWRLNDCEVCLDELPVLGSFVEVEGPCEAKITETLKMLGLDGLEHIQSGYASLISKKQKENSLGREV